MKQFIVLITVLAVVGIVVPAMADRNPERDGGNEMGPRHGKMRVGDHGRMHIFGDPQFLKKKLGLNDEQIDKIDVINEKFKLEHRAIGDKIRPMFKKMRKALKEDNVDLVKVRSILKEISDLQVEGRLLKIKHWLEIEKVLTSEQREKLKDMRGELFGPGMGGGPDGPGREMD